MREATEEQYKLAHQKMKMRVLSSFSDPDGIMPFGFGCPAMDADWGVDMPLARCQMRKKDRHEKEWTITYYLDESLFDLEKPKIDLDEIETLAQDLQIGYDSCVKRGEPLDECAWCQKYGCLLTANAAKQIATALEALPKLVEMLSEVEKQLSPMERISFDKLFDAAEWAKDTGLNQIREALTPFETTKTVEP